MTVGAFLEPFVVVTLLFGGAWFNRNKEYNFWEGTQGWGGHKRRDDVEIKRSSTEVLSPRSPTWSPGSSSPTLSADDESVWSLTSRRRKIQFFGYKRIVTTPNTLVFKDRFLSRVLQKFPFLIEAWYWALIYWVGWMIFVWFDSMRTLALCLSVVREANILSSSSRYTN